MDSAPTEPVDSDWIHHWYTPAGDITISLGRTGHGFLLRFPALADFIIDGDGREIGAWPFSGTDKETLRHLLLDQVLPRVLAHKGSLVLHASAVSVAGRAAAFLGETGYGKSTLAASLYLSGYSLLTDDALLIKFADDCIRGQSCYRNIRLGPQAISTLYKRLPACKPMASYSEKNRIKLSGNFDTAPVELAILFALTKLDGKGEAGPINVSPLSQREACMKLVRNAFQLDVSNHKLAKKIFAAASAVAERMPVFAISYPHDFSRLPEVHEAILQHYRKVAPETA